MNNIGHVSIVFEYDMMYAHVYRVKCFNFSNIRIRICIRTDFYIKICIRRMQILIKSVTSLLYLRAQLLRGWTETGEGKEKVSKGEGRGEVEGGIWPTQKFWCGTPYGINNTLHTSSIETTFLQDILGAHQ